MITIATDCSGIDAPIQALLQLNIPYTQLWYCDNNKYARKSSKHNYSKEPNVIYDDMLIRDNETLPSPDIYVCGFPCQPFSIAGKRLGTDDDRSNIIPKMLETIQYSKPKIAILENVKGFKSIEKGRPYKELIDFLENLNYYVYADIYNTKHYGLPQNRERIYIVCIRKDISKKEYIKPPKVDMIPFDDILIDKTIQKGELPIMYHKNLHKLKPNTKIISPKNFYSPMEYTSSTLCSSDCKYIYIIKQNRRILKEELLSLQGFPKDFKQVVSDYQFSKQIGNTMSVNVLKVIIKEVLSCI